MTAMSFISDPQRGQTNGSTSYTFAMSLAHAERQALCGTVCVLSGLSSAGSCWGCESLRNQHERNFAQGGRTGRCQRHVTRNQRYFLTSYLI